MTKNYFSGTFFLKCDNHFMLNGRLMGFLCGRLTTQEDQINLDIVRISTNYLVLIRVLKFYLLKFNLPDFDPFVRV